MEGGKKVTGTGIGAGMRRVEDRRFVTGKGDFVDDLALPNLAFAYIVRSPHAHAKIVSIDKGPACAAPGVFCRATIWMGLARQSGWDEAAA